MKQRAPLIVCLVFLGAWLFPKVLLTRIEPWQIGVRRSLTGGIAEEDFSFGYNFSLPLFHTYYRLPRNLLYLEYNDDDPNAEQKALEVRTSENNVIFVDVTVPYRIKEGDAWKIVREGFLDTYRSKVQSTTAGILRETLAEMNNVDIYNTEKRLHKADTILPKLNEALAQYHVTADRVVLRAIRFRPEYEQKLQDKQYFVVQGRLDDALRKESIAVQKTDTFEKTIEKEVALKREEWNEKIEQLKTQYELEIATIEAEAVQYDRSKRSAADASYSTSKAEGDLAEAKAEALGERLKASALASQAGQTYSAITAAENFKLGKIELNSNDPSFLQRFGSMAAWRKFFTGK
jgi:hypothetical protein